MLDIVFNSGFGDVLFDKTIAEIPLYDAFMDLDIEFRTIIILRNSQELSYESISKILKLPLGTVKSRINRGKLKLRDILSKRGINR